MGLMVLLVVNYSLPQWAQAISLGQPPLVIVYDSVFGCLQFTVPQYFL
jgi:hypothetical protein